MAHPCAASGKFMVTTWQTAIIPEWSVYFRSLVAHEGEEILTVRIKQFKHTTVHTNWFARKCMDGENLAPRLGPNPSVN